MKRPSLLSTGVNIISVEEDFIVELYSQFASGERAVFNTNVAHFFVRKNKNVIYRCGKKMSPFLQEIEE